MADQIILSFISIKLKIKHKDQKYSLRSLCAEEDSPLNDSILFSLLENLMRDKLLVLGI
jgi:hypothetical protein